MFKIDEIQRLGQTQFVQVLATAGQMQSGAQAIATAVGDYTKRSIEDGNAMMSELATVKSLDKAIEVQGDYAKLAYDNFVAESQKITELYADFAKQACKPFEGLMGKTTTAA